jgi:hypothetical protein
MKSNNALSPRALRNAKVTSTEIARKLGLDVTPPRRANINHVRLKKVTEASSPHDLCDALKEAMEHTYGSRLRDLRITQARGWYRAYARIRRGHRLADMAWHPAKKNGTSRAIRRTEMLRNIEAFQMNVRITESLVGA